MEKEKKMVIIVILLTGVMILSFSLLVITILQTSGGNGQPYANPDLEPLRVASLDTLPYTPNIDQQGVFSSYAPRVTQLGLPYHTYTPTPTAYASYAPRVTQLGLPYHTYTPTPTAYASYAPRVTQLGLPYHTYTPTPALPPYSEYVTSYPHKQYPVTTVSPIPVVPVMPRFPEVYKPHLFVK